MRMSAFILLLAACGNGSASPREQALASTRPGKALGHSLWKPNDYVGVVSARDSAVVMADFGARVEEVYVEMGAWVEKDAPLARLDDTTIAQQARSSEGAAAAARASHRGALVALADARRRHRVEQRLVAQGVSAPEIAHSAAAEVARAEAAAAEAEARLSSAEAEAALVSQRLQTSILRAPMPGFVSVLHIRRGDIVAPGQLIVRVTDPREVAIRFAVPAEDAEKLQQDQMIRFISGDLTLVGRVKEMTRDLEPPLQLIVAEASIEKAATMPKPGLVGTVHLEEFHAHNTTRKSQ